MNVFISVIALMLIATISMIMQRKYLTYLSVNYLSLILGLVCGFIPIVYHTVAAFNPDLFMLVVIAPLLYFEGQRTRLFDIARSLKIIIGLTVVMILLALISAGMSIYWLFGISMPLAFILAAISTPTDATAVETVTYGRKMPNKISYFLTNESLFNDASGIILLSMAIFWERHGSVQVNKTIYEFLQASLGGILLGIGIASVFILIRQALLRVEKKYQADLMELDTPLQIMQLLTPFIIYLIAEELKFSGIIAVVCAGLIENSEIQRSKFLHPKLAYNADELAKLIVALFNNIVFIVLGLVLARLIKIVASFDQATILAILIGVVLYLANILVRFIYVKFVEKFSIKESWLFALGGVHGAVTFALAYTLSEVKIGMGNLQMILLSESTLIILSMLVPTIIFRFILPKDIFNTQKINEIKDLRDEMINYVIAELNKIYLTKGLKKQVLFDLNSQNKNTTIKQFLREFKIVVKQRQLTHDEKEAEAQVYRYVFQKEREFLDQYAQEYPQAFIWLYREVVLAELVYFAEDY